MVVVVVVVVRRTIPLNLNTSHCHKQGIDRGGAKMNDDTKSRTSTGSFLQNPVQRET